MKYDKEFIKAVAGGKLELLKQLSPVEAFNLGLLIRQLEAEQKK